ncbi:hypothetical protein [Microcoleus sp.]|uniref:hypothetical protein n=1 Tax=Microcoleus sp. TaxID=44472 RepID=UPI003523F71A
MTDIDPNGQLQASYSFKMMEAIAPESAIPAIDKFRRKAVLDMTSYSYRVFCNLTISGKIHPYFD